MVLLLLVDAVVIAVDLSIAVEKTAVLSPVVGGCRQFGGAKAVEKLLIETAENRQ